MPSVLPRLLIAAAPSGLPGSGHLVRAGLGRAFGPAAFDPEDAPGDPGFFGPGSASWAVISDPAGIVGGIRALLVQLLHPLALAGVADHSHFRDDTIGRLQRTSAYVTATAFGSTREAFDAAATVRRVHRRVAGTAPDGRAYRADDPHLLAWVSVALTSSFLRTHRDYGLAPLTDDQADAFVAEQSRAGALLDERVDLAALRNDADAVDAFRRGDLTLPMIEEGRLPVTAAELASLLTMYAGEWVVDEQAKRTLRFLLWPELPAPLRAGYLPLLGGALASLDLAQRRLLGVRLGPTAPALRMQTRAALLALRLAAGPSPTLRAAERRASMAAVSAR